MVSTYRIINSQFKRRGEIYLITSLETHFEATLRCGQTKVTVKLLTSDPFVSKTLRQLLLIILQKVSEIRKLF